MRQTSGRWGWGAWG